MSQELTGEQLHKLYKELPQEIQEALASQETADAIESICRNHNIEDQRVSQVAQIVRDVLFGFTMPEEVEQILRKEAALKPEDAKKAAREINRFIFYPLKPALEQLHRMEIEVSANIVTPQPPTPQETREPPQTEKQQEQKSSDGYREPIE